MKWTVQSSIWLLYLITASLHSTDNDINQSEGTLTFWQFGWPIRGNFGTEWLTQAKTRTVCKERTCQYGQLCPIRRPSWSSLSRIAGGRSGGGGFRDDLGFLDTDSRQTFLYRCLFLALWLEKTFLQWGQILSSSPLSSLSLGFISFPWIVVRNKCWERLWSVKIHHPREES